MRAVTLSTASGAVTLEASGRTLTLETHDEEGEESGPAELTPSEADELARHLRLAARRVRRARKALTDCENPSPETKSYET
ncbi:MAG: hypothetical protein L0Y66_18385, partial [Myxococcaceae bacterium]|nr:hypothetical protein [Myxococcaceae bacterium]